MTDSENIYNRDVEEYSFGDLMTVKQFVAACKCGAFIDYDGYGNPVKDDKIAWDVQALPSAYEDIPKDATHIMWYNR